MLGNLQPIHPNAGRDHRTAEYPPLTDCAAHNARLLASVWIEIALSKDTTCASSSSSPLSPPPR